MPRLAAVALILFVASLHARPGSRRPVEDRTPRPPPPHRSSLAPPSAAEERDQLRPSRMRVPDLHGEARRHAAPDRARPRSRLSRARGVEQHRERQRDPRRPGAAPVVADRAEASVRRVQTAPCARPPLGTPSRAPARRWSREPPPAADCRRAQHRDLQDAAQGRQGAVLRAGAARRPARSAPRVASAGAAEPAAPAVVARVDPKPARRAAAGRARRILKPAPEPADGDDKVDWVWPAKGKVVTGFSEAASLKGIDIAGTSGQPVAASAGGKVVYAGTGLRGYGKLIIIKHNGTYLSAYAHNKEILVKEGQQVTRGQKIAEMGNTDADQVKLHFEIRRQGKPVDPLRYLPPA